MDLTDSVKKTIDDLSYRDMLKIWRFEPTGVPMFEGSSGLYFGRVMREKREKLEPGEHSRISRELSFGGL